MIEIEYKGGQIGKDSFLMHVADEGELVQIRIPLNEEQLKEWVKSINEFGYFEYRDFGTYPMGASGAGAGGFFNIIRQQVHSYWVVSGQRYWPSCSKYSYLNDKRPNTNKSY